MQSLQYMIEVAHAEGVKCGKARKQKDESRARAHRDWFRGFLLTCPESDRKQIQDAFDNGYSSEATPAVQHFR